MLPELESNSGWLPIGRHTVSIQDLIDRFVLNPDYSASQTRRGIWSDFMEITTRVRTIVPIVNIWIGGSFLTDKLDPCDIDVVYWFHDLALSHALIHSQEDDKRILIHFLNRKLNVPNVHYFPSIWHLKHEVSLGRHSEYDRYVTQRGHWDDFWLRRRSGPKDELPHPMDAMPRGGYIEIILDDFDAS